MYLWETSHNTFLPSLTNANWFGKSFTVVYIMKIVIIKINICPFIHIDLPSTSHAYSECWLSLGIIWLGIYVPYIWRVYFGSINYISVWKWQRRGLPAELIETFSYTQYASIKNQTCEEKAKNLQMHILRSNTIFFRNSVRTIFETIKTPIGTKIEKQIRKHTSFLKKASKSLTANMNFEIQTLIFLC